MVRAHRKLIPALRRRTPSFLGHALGRFDCAAHPDDDCSRIFRLREGGQCKGRKRLTPVEFDGSLNRPLGMPEGVYHFAFEAGSQAELEAKRAELISKHVKVTPIVDHEWAKSIYFKDPNGLLLEYSYLTREFNEDDGVMQPRFEMSFSEASPLTDFRDR